MIQKLWSHKIVRFISVGLCNTTLDFIMLNIMVFIFGFATLVANTVSVCIGVTISFFLNHRFVFNKKDAPTLNAFLKFFVVTGTGVVVMQGAVISVSRPLYVKVLHLVNSGALLRHEDKITLNLAKITAVLVAMVVNYLIYSKVIFVEKIVEA